MRFTRDKMDFSAAIDLSVRARANGGRSAIVDVREVLVAVVATDDCVWRLCSAILDASWNIDSEMKNDAGLRGCSSSMA